MRYGVEITSFLYCGALGAEHYYGKLWTYDESKEDWRNQIWKEELKQPMSQKMASYLNKKDGYSKWRAYHKGDLTDRFDSKEDIYKAAIKFFTAKFGKNITIEDGDFCCDQEDNTIIYTPHPTNKEQS